MKYEETNKLKSSLRRKRKAPNTLWCEYIEGVAVFLETHGFTEFGGPDVLLHHLCDRVRWYRATQKDIIAYLRELWTERVPSAPFPEAPTKKPMPKRPKTTKLDPRRIQRLMARYTLLDHKSGWKRTKAEEKEMQNLRAQLAKYGINAR